MRDIKVQVCRADDHSIFRGDVLLPLYREDALWLFGRYRASSQSRMIKGKRCITGDHEVQHIKRSSLMAPVVENRKPHTLTVPASLTAVGPVWETKPMHPGSSTVRSKYYLAPGVTNRMRWKMKRRSSSRYYAIIYDVSLHAVTPYLYVIYKHRYMSDDGTSWNDIPSRLNARTEATYLYVDSRSRWTSGTTITRHHDYTATYDNPDFSWVGKVEYELDNEIIALTKSLIPDEPNEKLGHSVSTSGWYTMTYSYKDSPLSSAKSLKGIDWRPPSQRELGELCQAAVDNLNYVEINTIAYLKDLKDFGSELRSLAKLVSNPLNPKAWASFFLNTQYGSRLTIADTFELFNGVIRRSKELTKRSRHTWRTCRARTNVPIESSYGTGIRTTNYKVYYNPLEAGIMSYVQKFAQWDLLPTAANIWDFIPYSFVVDWFVDIGGFLEAIDSRVAAASYDVIGVLYSTKDVYSHPGESNDSIEYIYSMTTVYTRRWSRELHPPPIILEGSDGFLHNIPQLLAILVQKFK